MMKQEGIHRSRRGARVSRRRFRCVGITLFGLILAGCSTVPDPYMPSTPGAFDRGSTQNGLKLVIEPIHSTNAFREPINFRVRIKNVGEQATWVPRSPQFLFYWIYPSGRRDHYVVELPPAMHFTERTAVLLPPGQQMIYAERIDTFYFPRAGITEFRAVFHAPHNLNPDLEPFWSGRLTSNAYGVQLMN